MNERQERKIAAGGWSGKALLGVSIWGASFVATRIALTSFTPIGLVALRLLAAILVLGIAASVSRGRLVPPARELPVAFLLGAILAAHQYIQAAGLVHTSAINAGWIIAFTPIPIALGGRLFLGERLSARGWIGVTVASAGIVLIIAFTTPGFLNARTGDLWQILSCFTWAAYTLAGARIVARNGALTVLVPATLAGGVLLVAGASVTGFTHAPVTAGSLAAFLFLGLICSGLGYWLWYKAMDEHGAARVGSYLYFEPFVTVAVAAALLGEPVTIHVIGGGLLVLLGVWSVAREKFVKR